jgi:DNA repair exonuclease SbcCD ATPase subunit
MAILRINKLEWSNFLSYGDYESSLDLLSLGPVLIIGSKDGRPDESNGTGKSGITIAIIWCLFGRTPRKSSPGDKVINFTTKKECYVRITTTDGWTITRTRNLNGHDDLLINKDGKDITLSTNKNAQQLLNKLFNLDYEIFTSSMFFGQRTQSFLDMSDVKRKSALERMLGLNRLNVWGDIAKEKRTAIEIEQQKLCAVADIFKNDIKRLTDQASHAEQKIEGFEQERSNKTIHFKAQIKKLNDEALTIVLPDLELIKSNYLIYKQKITKLSDNKIKLLKADTALTQLNIDIERLKRSLVNYKTKFDTIKVVDVNELVESHKNADRLVNLYNDLNSKLSIFVLEQRKIKQDITSTNETIFEWNNKNGTKCPSCQQLITNEHTTDLCKPYVDKLPELCSKLEKINKAIASIMAMIKDIIINRPSMTVDEAIRTLNDKNSIKLEIADIDDKISQKLDYKTKLIDVNSRILDLVHELSEEIKLDDVEIGLMNAERVHLRYSEIHKSITDLDERIAEESSRQNPYLDIKSTFLCDLNDSQNKLSDTLLNITKFDNLIKQYEYIRRSYHDRNKIKMFVISELVGYLNQRIEYYLNAFECDLQLRFTSTLSIETSKWDYDFHSGGQQKRIDLAIMFAIYDLYISMYGQQCNVMVLDEIDGSLDQHGVRAFVDVIHNDFSGDRPDKPDTILVISHKAEMADQFSNQITVLQDIDGFSRIVS